jgi:hypothetical protein
VDHLEIFGRELSTRDDKKCLPFASTGDEAYVFLSLGSNPNESLSIPQRIYVQLQMNMSTLNGRMSVGYTGKKMVPFFRGHQV